jgi:hypothetical protein
MIKLKRQNHDLSVLSIGYTKEVNAMQGVSQRPKTRELTLTNILLILAWREGQGFHCDEIFKGLYSPQRPGAIESCNYTAFCPAAAT